MQTIGDAEVHVWQISLEPGEFLQAAEAALAADERGRAERFVFERDRRRYVKGRVALRHILTGYLDAQPAEIVFAYGSYGKPSLARGGRADWPDVRFNLAHSGDHALLAVTLGREVGIDLEMMRADIDVAGIAERFFSPREAAQLLGLSEDERLRAFYRCWTRKEAYLKAHGAGLTIGLDRFDVSLAPGEPAALLRTLDDPAEAGRWRLMDVDGGPAAAAALAVEGGEAKFEMMVWEDEVSRKQ